jgi:hypothetical protein
MSTNEKQPIDPNRGFRLEPEFPDEDIPRVTEHHPGDPEIEKTLRQHEEPIIVIDNIDQIPLAQEAIVIASHMGRITGKLEREMQGLAESGNAIAAKVNAIIPTDQPTYHELCERLEECKKFSEGVEEWAEPWRNLFYRPYKAVLERVTGITTGPITAHQRGKARRLQFEREVREAEQKRESLRLQAEQKQREEETRIKNAETAEALGMSEQAVDTLLTQPSVAPTPVAAPMISRPQGVRKIAPNWQAELTDKAAFWKWAKAQKEMPAMLLIDQPTMNREAKTHKATLGQKYPGWRGVNKGGD